MAPFEEREYDIVVYGATGFSGQLLAEYLVKNYYSKGDIKLAFGGRNQAKLEGVKQTLAKQYPLADKIPILVGDSSDLEALVAIAEQTRVVATTVGPYTKYGTPLVEACARSGTSYCDLTGEPNWHATMFNRFDKIAKETGARIVHQAGFDSVPSDIGVYLTAQTFRERFGRDVEKIDMAVKLRGGGIQGGTIDTVMNELVNGSESRRVAKASKKGAPPLPSKGKTKSVKNLLLSFNTASQRWGFLFFMAGANCPYVSRSNGRLGYSKNLVYQETMVFGSFLQALAAYLGFIIFGILLVLPPTRWLLQRFVLPAPGQGPSKESCEKASYSMIFRGTDGSQGDVVDVKLEAVGDASCISTTCCIAETAMALSKDAASLTSSGGVITAAAAMGDVLLERLNATPLFNIAATAADSE
jgi:short subunit dehydrogenase-like uncharacterized protein